MYVTNEPINQPTNQPSMPFSSIDDQIAKLQQFNNKGGFDRDDKTSAKISAIAGKAIESMKQSAAEFLHVSLDDEKHSEEHVKATIDVFAESLSIKDKHGVIPIQCAAGRSESVAFVPLMAQEGLLLGVGGEESRGGLLTADKNVFVDLSYIEDDEKCKKVLEQLRELDFFQKEDIRNFDLLYHFLCDGCAQRFEMLAAWDPQSLMTSTCNGGEPLIHDADMTEETFEMILKAGMRHFPERLGFLFRTYKGKTACETAFYELGAEIAIRIICRCIPPGENHPILHMAADSAPHMHMHLEDMLMKHYREEAYTKDATGRTVSQVRFHAQLRQGDTLSLTSANDNASFFRKATDDQIESKDPRSGLYPFMMAAASDQKSDLDAVNYLLRRCPKLLAAQYE